MKRGRGFPTNYELKIEGRIEALPMPESGFWAFLRSSEGSFQRPIMQEKNVAFAVFAESRGICSSLGGARECLANA